MKAIPHILSKVYCEPWLILPEKHRAIQQSLEAHLLDAGDDYESGDSSQEPPTPPYDLIDGVAIIRVCGLIGKRLSWLETMCGGYDVDVLTASIQAAVDDWSARQIVIDWDTPGGISTGVLEAGAAIRNASRRKPVISYTETQCCSAGIWMASQARSFYASTSSAVGSIGVYAVFLDESVQLEQLGVKVNAISSGKYKLAGAPFKPMTDDERAMFQARAKRLHDQFKTAVKTARPQLPDEAMEGQVFDGEEAAEIGLTDGVFDTLDELLESISGLY